MFCAIIFEKQILFEDNLYINGLIFKNTIFFEDRRRI